MDQQQVPMTNQEMELSLAEQRLRRGMQILTWARSGGKEELAQVQALLPSWTVDVTETLCLTGRVTIDHWDDIDGLLNKMEYLVGGVQITVDQPEFRTRRYEANAHPYLTVRLDVMVRDTSSKLTVDKTPVTRVLQDYSWKDMQGLQ